MYKILLYLFISSVLITKAQTVYPSLNINLLAHLTPETDLTGQDNRKYSGCWGWYQASKNKEYAIVGTSSKTYFIDVSNPTAPIINDSVMAKRAGCIWREIKTYQNYCYIVSDDGGPNSFQIIDLQYLPDSVHVVHDGTTYFERSHTIYIDNDKLYCGYVHGAGGSPYSPMQIYSLATPTAPLLLSKIEDYISSTIIDQVHDMFVRNDTIFASAGGKGFHVLKFNSLDNSINLLQSFTGYAYSGYNHSSWQTDDRKTMVMADEVPNGLPAKVIDISDFNNIHIVDTIRSNFGSTAHNPYIMGNKWCWISTYHDGLILYDISNPSNTTVYGSFDTYPQQGIGNTNATYTSYRGNWGAYPYLPSKIIIACDMQNGIFILEGDNNYKSTVNNTGIKQSNVLAPSFNIVPNPAKNELYVILANQQHKNIVIKIIDVLGKQVLNQELDVNEMLYKTQVNTSSLANGCYNVLLVGDNFKESKKIIIQK